MVTENVDPLSFLNPIPNFKFVDSRKYVVRGMVVVPKDHINDGFSAEMVKGPSIFKGVCTINQYQTYVEKLQAEGKI